MTADPHTVLLIPHEGDPHGLLAPGAPVADPDNGSRGWVVPLGPRWEDDPHWKPQNDGAIGTGLAVWRPGYGLTALTGWALVLAWEGEPAWQGMAQAHKATSAVDGAVSWPSYVVVRDVLKWARIWAAKDVGTIVLLDEHGHEVVP